MSKKYLFIVSRLKNKIWRIKNYDVSKKKFILFVVSVAYYKKKFPLFFINKKEFLGFIKQIDKYYFKKDESSNSIIMENFKKMYKININWEKIQILYLDIIKYFEIDNSFFNKKFKKSILIKNIDKQIEETIKYLRVHAKITDEIGEAFPFDLNEIIIINNFIFRLR